MKYLRINDGECPVILVRNDFDVQLLPRLKLGCISQRLVTDLVQSLQHTQKIKSLLQLLNKS